MATTKQRPTGNEIQAMLQEGHFQSSAELQPADPVTTVQLVLTLDKIKAYDRNPRREINPAYDEIKASIRNQRGLNNHFNVTRRPDDNKYMIESGGNTRLKILQELWTETHDETFNQVHCLYVPWQSEAHLLSAHLIENELRGEMTLIDKAYAIQELKHQLEQQQDNPLSQRAFMKAAEALGYRLSGRHARRLAYALELDQLIPEALRAGLGGHKLDEIKSLEKVYDRFCTGKTEQLPVLFAHIMTEHDGPEWHLDAVRRELDRRLSELIALPAQRIRREVDAALFNATTSESEVIGITHEQRGKETEPLSKLPDHPPDRQASIPNPLADNPSGAAIHETNSTIPSHQQPKTASHADPVKQPISSDGMITPSSNQETNLPVEHDLKSLRDHCYQLAQRIAKTVHLEVVMTTANSGYGYIIDAPDEPLENPRTWGIWWLLFGISEQSASEQRLMRWQHTRLYQWFSADNEARLTEQLGTPPALQTFFYLFLSDSALIDDTVFADCYRLIESCRLIRRTVAEATLWSDDPN